MANLSNINNILRTGSLGVGINRDPLSAFEISSATKPGIKMFNTATNGKTYQAYSDENGNYIIYDEDADDNRFIINSSGNATFAGNVGIGAAASDGNLHVRKTGVNTGITNVLMNANFADGSNGTGLSIGYRTDETTAVIAARTATGNIAFYSYDGGWSESMRIKNNGNVGIGTDSPRAVGSGYKGLEVSSSSSGSSLWLSGFSDTTKGYLAMDTGGLNLTAISNHSLTFGTNNSPKMTILSSGNVGIGATNPLRKLHVVGQLAINNATTEYYGVLIQGGEGADPSVLIGDWHNSSGTIKWDSTGHYLRIDSQHSAANGAILFSGNDGSTEYMRITSGGEVGIGTNFVSAKLQVHSTNAGQPTIPLFIVNESTTIGTEARLGFAANTNNDVGTNRYSYISTINTSGSNGQDMTFATNATGASAVERMRIKSDGNILIADTRQIQFYNTDQYIRASSTNDLEVVAGDDINYRSNFSRFFSGSAEHARLTGIGGTSWVVNGSATHLFGVGLTNPSTKLTVKDSQDSSLYSGLKVERSANTTGAYLNAVGGALNLNTDSSMPLKFRIQNSSMQTINTDGGRAYAANASGLNMKEYGYNFTANNGVTVDLIENTNAHSDIAMVQISITAYHSSRTFFAGMGTFGGYGFHLTGAGNGLGNGGLTSTSTGTGTRKLQWSNTSGYNAVVRLYIQIRTESGITVLNGTLSSL